MIKEPFLKSEGLLGQKTIKQINIGESEDMEAEQTEISKEKSTDILIEMFTLIEKKNRLPESDEEEEEDSQEEDDHEDAQNSSKLGANTNSNLMKRGGTNLVPIKQPPNGSVKPNSTVSTVGTSNPTAKTGSKQGSRKNSSDSSR